MAEEVGAIDDERQAQEHDAYRDGGAQPDCQSLPRGEEQLDGDGSGESDE